MGNRLATGTGKVGHYIVGLQFSIEESVDPNSDYSSSSSGHVILCDVKHGIKGVWIAPMANPGQKDRVFLPCKDLSGGSDDTGGMDDDITDPSVKVNNLFFPETFVLSNIEIDEPVENVAALRIIATSLEDVCCSTTNDVSGCDPVSVVYSMELQHREYDHPLISSQILADPRGSMPQKGCYLTTFSFEYNDASDSFTLTPNFEYGIHTAQTHGKENHLISGVRFVMPKSTTDKIYIPGVFVVPFDGEPKNGDNTHDNRLEMSHYHGEVLDYLDDASIEHPIFVGSNYDPYDPETMQMDVHFEPGYYLTDITMHIVQTSPNSRKKASLTLKSQRRDDGGSKVALENSYQIDNFSLFIKDENGAAPDWEYGVLDQAQVVNHGEFAKGYFVTSFKTSYSGTDTVNDDPAPSVISFEVDPTYEEVAPLAKKGMDTGTIIIIIGGVVIVLLVLYIIFFCGCKENDKSMIPKQKGSWTRWFGGKKKSPLPPPPPAPVDPKPQPKSPDLETEKPPGREGEKEGAGMLDFDF